RERKKEGKSEDSSSRIKVIQHQVNYDAGYRNVQPHRQGPTRDPLVALKIAPQRAPNSQDHKGDYHCREESVSIKYAEINWAHDSLPREFRHAMKIGRAHV